jgi:hypothetical protein
MTSISATIKIALENAVLCRGAHGAKESYEYAEKMEIVIKQAIKEKLLEALENIEDLEESIYDLLDELEEETK